MGRRLGKLLWVVFLALALRACVIEPVRLTDDSMSPRLLDGDVGLVSKLNYGLRVPGAGTMIFEWAKPKVGDLVVAVAVGDPPISILRKISAVAGDSITLPDGQAAVLAEGQFFLAAEQKDIGVDSRKLGPVPRKAIVGKVTHLWSSKKSSTEAGSGVESQKPAWRVLQPL